MTHPTDTERAHIEEALQHKLSALAAVRFTGTPVDVGHALVEVAELHGMLEDHAASRQAYEEALGFFQKGKSRSGQGEALFGLGVSYAHFEDHKSAIELIAKAALLFNEVKDRENEALCRAAIGESLRALGQTQGAEEKYQEALELFQQSKEHQDRAGALLLDLGDLRMEKGDYEGARSRFLEALSLLRHGEDPEPLALCHLLLGEAEGLLKNHDGARPHLLQAAELYAQLHDHIYESRARWDLGLACYFLKDWKASREQFEAVVPLFESQGRHDEVAKVKNILAHFEASGV